MVFQDRSKPRPTWAYTRPADSARAASPAIARTRRDILNLKRYISVLLSLPTPPVPTRLYACVPTLRIHQGLPGAGAALSLHYLALDSQCQLSVDRRGATGTDYLAAERERYTKPRTPACLNCPPTHPPVGMRPPV